MSEDRDTRLDRQAVIREWARKTYMRAHLRTDALTADELKTLDERRARWTSDRQAEGRQPPDWELRGGYPALAKEVRSGRGAARPIFTPEELHEVDAGRAAASLRNRIDRGQNHGPALRQRATQNMIVHGIGELDARKAITDRFAALYRRAVTDYVRAQRREKGPGKTDQCVSRIGGSLVTAISARLSRAPNKREACQEPHLERREAAIGVAGSPRRPRRSGCEERVERDRGRPRAAGHSGRFTRPPREGSLPDGQDPKGLGARSA